MSSQTILLVYMTFDSVDMAKMVSHTLLSERLAACTNILPSIESNYWWEGKIESSTECVLLAKTTSQLFDRLKERVIELHTYDCPCVIAWPLTKGHSPYFDWLKGALQ